MSDHNQAPATSAVKMLSIASARCPLLELPNELRLQIYEYLFKDWKDHFDSDRPAGMEFYTHGVMRLRVRPHGTLVPAWRCERPGILLSCKQLRRESTDVLYDKTLFYYHMNRPNGGIRCDGTFLDGGVQNLELHVRIYSTRELENAIGQMVSIFETMPRERKYTSVKVWLFAFNNYERMRRDKTFSPEDSNQAWLGLSRLMRLEFECVPEFTLDKSWQRALGPGRVEQLRQKANVVTLPRRVQS